MGKILVIKDADFSANAVVKGLVEPTEYISVKGFGTSSQFSVGDYFINPNFPNVVMQKISGGTTNIETECFAKYDGKNYYLHLNPGISGTSKFEPNYGLLRVEPLVTQNTVAQISDNTVSFVTNSSFILLSVDVPVGASFTWVAGGASVTAIKEESGVATSLSTITCVGNIVYKNETNAPAKLYINVAKTWSSYWVARIVG